MLVSGVQCTDSAMCYIYACVCVCVCLVMSNSNDPMDCSLPGSSVHGIFQGRMLGWVAISFSRGFSWPRNRTQVSYTAGRFFTNWAMRETQNGWEWAKFNSDDHYIYYCEQKSIRRNGVALRVNKSLKCSTWMQSQKWQNDFCSFPRQTIQYHNNPSLRSNAEEAEVE